MVLASSFMRSTNATYSSRTPGLKRERKTVISMMSLPRQQYDRSIAHRVYSTIALASAWRLLFAFRQCVQRSDPRARRANPLLAARRQLISLAQDADPHRVGWLYAFADGRRIDRRAALTAKRLHARKAAVGSVLHVDFGLPFHL